MKHPKHIAANVKKTDSEIRDKAFDELSNLFKGNTLFIHDCIKQICQQHSLDYRDPNIQAAFAKVVIGIKKMNYS